MISKAGGANLELETPSALIPGPQEKAPAAEDQRPLTRKQRFSIKLRLSETPRQTGMLFSAQTGATFAGFLATAAQMRWMDPNEVGRLAFSLSFVIIASLFFEFGIFSAGARVLALAEDRRGEQRALGALVLMAAVIGLIFSLFVIAAAAPVDMIFKTNVRWLLIGASALAFFLPFQLLIEQSCQGLNRIRDLSAFQLMMSGSYLLILLALAVARRLNAESALLAYLAGVGVASVWTLVRLRPSFERVSPYVKVALRETRGYGLNIYLARITGTASARLDNLIIAYFLGRASGGLAPLGFYSIAQRLSGPIITLSRSLAITRFRAFAKLARVPERIVKWNAAVLVCASVALVAIGPLMFRLVFPKFGEVIPLLLPFALISLFAGLFQPYNMFLASHGRGAEIRNIAMLYTVASLLGLIVAVPGFGVKGAAWVGAAAMALDYCLHLYYYRRFRHKLAREDAKSARPDLAAELPGPER